MHTLEPPTATVAVDLVVLTIRRGTLSALVTAERRASELALPGGFVGSRDGFLDVVRRELTPHSETAHVEQLCAHTAPVRGPSGRVLSVAYLAVAPDRRYTREPGQAWLPVAELLRSARLRLASGHRRVLQNGLDRVRAKLEYSTLATAFCAELFTIRELRHVYEAVWDTALDPRNFQRKVLGTRDFVVPTNQLRRAGAGRPARLYQRGPAVLLHPSIVRVIEPIHPARGRE